MFAISLPAARHRLSAFAYSKAVNLFSAGEEYGYGVLFRSAFRINPVVSQPNDYLLSSLDTLLRGKFNPSRSDKVVIDPFYIGKLCCCVSG